MLSKETTKHIKTTKNDKRIRNDGKNNHSRIQRKKVEATEAKIEKFEKQALIIFNTTWAYWIHCLDVAFNS